MTAATEVSAREVEALRAQVLADPGLVLDDPELMRALIDATGGEARNVVDLRGALVRRLETRLEKLERAHRSVIAAAYENLAGAGQVHRAALRLLDAADRPAFLRALLVDAPDIVAVDAARLALEPGAEAGEEMGGRVVPVPEGAIEAYLALGDAPGRDGVWLRPAPAEAELIWGDEAALARSEALITLDLGSTRGLVALGAEDSARFSPEHGADLVAFLGGVMERTARRWLVP